MQAAANAIRQLGGAPVVLPGPPTDGAPLPSPTATQAAQSSSTLLRVESFALDGRPRTALVVRKARGTPGAYPRAPGTPNKSPL